MLISSELYHYLKAFSMIIDPVLIHSSHCALEKCIFRSAIGLNLNVLVGL